MRFVDTNIFIYAFLKPKRRLSEQEIKIKKSSQEILRRVENGEKAAVSVIQISEIVNLLTAVGTLELAQSFLERIFSLPSLQIFTIEPEDYFLANELSKKLKAGINDCLTFLLMQRHKIKEVYSFDKDFDRFLGIKRVGE